MRIEQVVCDQCGARKSKEAKWYRVISGREGFHLYKSNADISDDVDKDYCSDNCVVLALNDFLSSEHGPPVPNKNVGDFFSHLKGNNG